MLGFFVSAEVNSNFSWGRHKITNQLWILINLTKFLSLFITVNVYARCEANNLKHLVNKSCFFYSSFLFFFYGRHRLCKKPIQTHASYKLPPSMVNTSQYPNMAQTLKVSVSIVIFCKLCLKIVILLSFCKPWCTSFWMNHLHVHLCGSGNNERGEGGGEWRGTFFADIYVLNGTLLSHFLHICFSFLQIHVYIYLYTWIFTLLFTLYHFAIHITKRIK